MANVEHPVFEHLQIESTRSFEINTNKFMKMECRLEEYYNVLERLDEPARVIFRPKIGFNFVETSSDIHPIDDRKSQFARIYQDEWNQLMGKGSLILFDLEHMSGESGSLHVDTPYAKVYTNNYENFRVICIDDSKENERGFCIIENSLMNLLKQSAEIQQEYIHLKEIVNDRIDQLLTEYGPRVQLSGSNRQVKLERITEEIREYHPRGGI